MLFNFSLPGLSNGEFFLTVLISFSLPRPSFLYKWFVIDFRQPLRAPGPNVGLRRPVSPRYWAHHHMVTELARRHLFSGTDIVYLLLQPLARLEAALPSIWASGSPHLSLWFQKSSLAPVSDFLLHKEQLS